MVSLLDWLESSEFRNTKLTWLAKMIHVEVWFILYDRGDIKNHFMINTYEFNRLISCLIWYMFIPSFQCIKRSAFQGLDTLVLEVVLTQEQKILELIEICVQGLLWLKGFVHEGISSITLSSKVDSSTQRKLYFLFSDLMHLKSQAIGTFDSKTSMVLSIRYQLL